MFWGVVTFPVTVVLYLLGKSFYLVRWRRTYVQSVTPKRFPTEHYMWMGLEALSAELHAQSKALAEMTKDLEPRHVAYKGNPCTEAIALCRGRIRAVTLQIVKQRGDNETQQFVRKIPLARLSDDALDHLMETDTKKLLAQMKATQEMMADVLKFCETHDKSEIDAEKIARLKSLMVITFEILNQRKFPLYQD